MKASRRFGLLLWALSALVACAGTETGNPSTRSACPGVVCGACAPPIVLRVKDALSLGPVAALAINGDVSLCAPGTADTICQLHGAPYTTPGTHRIELSAAGYETRDVDVVVSASQPGLCCGCGYTPTNLDLALSPL